MAGGKFAWWFAINPHGALAPDSPIEMGSYKSSRPIPFLFYDWILEYPKVELVGENAKSGELIHAMVRLEVKPSDALETGCGYAVLRDGNKMLLNPRTWIANNAFHGTLEADDLYVAQSAEPDLCNGELVKLSECAEFAGVLGPYGSDWAARDREFYLFMGYQNSVMKVEQLQFIITVDKGEAAEADARFVVTRGGLHDDAEMDTHVYKLHGVDGERDPAGEVYQRFQEWQVQKEQLETELMQNCPRMV